MIDNKNKTLTELAKLAVKNYIEKGKIIEPRENLPKQFSNSELAEVLTKKAGVFVTIEKEDNLRGLSRDERKRILRGCVGTYLPTKENIAQEIISNAISAAVNDYRFGPVQEKELPNLSYTVYILSKPEIVEGIQNLKEISEEKLKKAGLDSKKYGIIVESGIKKGLLLPDLEGIDTVSQQILIACQKAGINPIKEKITIYKFAVKKYN